MPTYSYRCNKCKVEFDVVQKMSDDKLKHCKDCNTETLVRIITSTNGFELRGKGWFKSGGY